MKFTLPLLFVALLSLSACKQNSETSETEAPEMGEEVAMNDYQSFGDKITDEEAMTSAEMASKFKDLKPGDTVAVKFKAEVNSVCQNKGCWMRLDTGEEETLVKFKDYGFFMPKDIAGDEVIVNGLAFVDEMSVDDQRHLAEDAGKTPEEVAAITEPKRTLSIISDGVLLVVDEE
ncbi:DUF4920 domain-containing protein [Altibacter sp. HG106]|uniref:DUF4920 domain-containing protein n=1 Tax=Altibacter sp. HG106 TaxID=3023937 RepID=UPI00234FC740|nr:DUF4920 domain-containing protein [Altibacter sp. HG106]MDC7995769.1 DUF4920 domain-containing protein [Altibacter sp. HG106]